MIRVIEALGFVATGVLGGALSAYVLIQSTGAGPLQPGSPWYTRAAALTGGSSYYVRLHYLIEGRLPPAPGQMSESTAAADDQGQPLTSSCRYRLTAVAELPSWWSVTVTDPGSDGALRQSTVDSDSVVRESNGATIIVASRAPEPGNWLKIPPSRRLTAQSCRVDYPQVIESAAQDLAPHLIGFYLKDLAADFHSYYNASRFLVEEEGIKQARLALIAAVAQVMRNGLVLLGVSAPEKM